MLRNLMKRVDNIQKQMGNVSRQGNSKNQKEMVEIKNTVTEFP